MSSLPLQHSESSYEKKLAYRFLLLGGVARGKSRFFVSSDAFAIPFIRKRTDSGTTLRQYGMVGTQVVLPGHPPREEGGILIFITACPWACRSPRINSPPPPPPAAAAGRPTILFQF
jgi:hypothetical protein